MLSQQFVNTCMACTIPFDNNTIHGNPPPDIPNIVSANIHDIIMDTDNNIPNNSIRYIPITTPNLMYTNNWVPRRQFNTFQQKLPKFNTKRYHNIHQPGRTNCDQRSRI